MLCVDFREQSPNRRDKVRCPSYTASAVCFRSLGVQTSLCREFKGVCTVIHCFFRCLEGKVNLSRQAVQPAVLLLLPEKPRVVTLRAGDSLAPPGGTVLYQMGARGDLPANSDPVIALCRLRLAGGNIHKECWCNSVEPQCNRVTLFQFFVFLTRMLVGPRQTAGLTSEYKSLPTHRETAF